MSSGFDLLTGARKKLCLCFVLRSLLITLRFLFTSCKKSWFLQQSKKQGLLTVSVGLRSKRYVVLIFGWRK
uniref:Uncharacterized protein n=1 Tax=Rhizophora mucronata TaxID=61149 RepID=A0A2P2ISW7_RHIMU